MYNKTRLFFLSLTVVMVLIFGAVGPTPVYADDGTTPPPDAPVVDEPSADVPDVEVPAADAPVVDAPSADVPIVDAAPTDVPAVDAPVADAPAEDLTVPEVLEQLPAGTDLVVVDQNGEALPLASVEAAEVLAAPDPYFTVTVAGTPTLFQWFATAGACGGAPNCVDGTTTPIQDAIDYLSSNDYKPDDGYVYVENGTYVEDVTVDGLNWITTPAFLGLVSENGSLSTFLDGYFEISNMNDFTLAGFTVRDDGGAVNDTYVYAHDNTGTLTLEDLYVTNHGGDGITVEDHTGDVSVTGVNSSFNNGNGATIQATGSVDILNAHFDNNYSLGASLTGSKVFVENSTFNNNGSGSDQDPTGQGLIVDSRGKVTLVGVTANNNQLFGANIQALGNVAISNSFFSGNQVYTWSSGEYAYEGGYGLQVFTTGNVALNNVTATNNLFFGASVTGTDIAIDRSFFNSNGSGLDENLTGKGLIVESGGSVALSSVEANDNQLFGANIQAQDDVSIVNSFFSGNKVYTWSRGEGFTYYGYGLQVVTTGGAVSLAGVDASNNNLNGASLTGEDVSIDSSTFNSNSSGRLDGYGSPTGTGLFVNGSGLVSLSSVQANNNQRFGANIQATDQVSISSSFFSGNQSYEDTPQGQIFYGYGLQVVTTGNTTTDLYNILLNGVTADENNLWGANLDGLGVEVKNSSFSNNNSSQGQNFFGYGLQVVAPGNILLDGVTANFNNLWGGSLDGLDVTILDSQFNNNVSDSYIFIDDTGLLVKSAGNVLLDNVEAKENRLIGADIVATGNVTITTTLENATITNGSSFSHNQGFTCFYSDCIDMTFHGYGLQVLTPGIIFLDGVTADENNLWGASLNGSEVTVNNSTFNNNSSGQGPTFYGYGLQVVTPGNIFLNGVTANFNNLWGASLDGLNVEVKNSQFNNNVSPSYVFIDDSGLLVNSSGNVLLDNVEANENRRVGADIIATGDVTITSSVLPPGETPLTTNGSSFSHNQGFTCLDSACNNMVFHGYGLQVLTPGIIFLDGVTANENNLWGASLSGSQVTVNNSTFNLNKGTGLSITTSGPVTLTNVTATNNGLNGVDIIGNCSSVGVTDGTYSNNGQYGINAVSAKVTLVGPTIENNPAGPINQTFEGCPEVAPTTTTTTVADGGNAAPQDGQPAEGNPEEDNASADTDTPATETATTATTATITATITSRHHDNRDYGVALQSCKWCNYFRGHFFSYPSSGMEFSENYHSHHYGHRHHR